MLPDMEVGDVVKQVNSKPEQHFTQPPARYSEATLIKTLEENGVGRPSTYAPTIETIQNATTFVWQPNVLNQQSWEKLLTNSSLNTSQILSM